MYSGQTPPLRDQASPSQLSLHQPQQLYRQQQQPPQQQPLPLQQQQPYQQQYQQQYQQYPAQPQPQQQQQQQQQQYQKHPPLQQPQQQQQQQQLEQQHQPQPQQQHQQQLHQHQQHQHQHQQLPSPREFTIVALGKSGEGKSTLLNAILGREIFLAKASVSEVTQHVDKATNHFLNIPSNPVMHCIDTPSFNGKLHDPNRVHDIGVLLTKVAAGVDAFLFVVKCTRYRYDNTFHQTLQTYQSLFTPAFWSKLIIVFTHATPELLPDTQLRVPLMAWAREIQDNFKLPSPPLVVFTMDYARFPYPAGGAQDFWERLMELDANTEPYCHKPFLESFGNGIAVGGYVQRIKGHLALFEPSFFEEQAEGEYQQQQRGIKKPKEHRFNLFRKRAQASR